MTDRLDTADFSAAAASTERAVLCPTPILRPFYDDIATGMDDAVWRDSIDLAGFDGLACEARAGELVSVRLLEGPQIVCLFAFNLHDPDEHYWHQSNVREGFFLTRFTRLWGSMARCRPLLTVIDDTVTPRGGDAPHGYHHPILAGLGTPREWQAHGGSADVATTWQQFAGLMATRGIDSYHLSENIALFQKAQIDVRAQRFDRIPSDALAGDSLTLFAEIDLCLLFALSPYLDGAADVPSRAHLRPLPVRISISERVTAPLPWPYPGVPYPDLSLYLGEDGTRSDTVQLTPGIPNTVPESAS